MIIDQIHTTIWLILQKILILKTLEESMDFGPPVQKTIAHDR
jgi:hypothetical protein